MRPDGPVVIALDGSPHSEQTLEWGLAEAQLRRADVVLARTYQEPREYTQWSWYPILDDLRFDTEARQYLSATQEKASVRVPELSITTQLLHGPEVPELRALSDDAQLLVVGARGHGGGGHIGRVSAHLTAHARCPVTVVRDVPEPSGPVVVGVDGSASSLVAARVAAREAALRRVPLVVLHGRSVMPAPYGAEGLGLLTPLASTLEDDPTRGAAEGVAASLRGEHPGLEVRSEVVDDDPVRALVSRSPGAALLVVGSRGLGAFRGMLLGSVSNEVVRTAPGTVLVVHDVAE